MSKEKTATFRYKCRRCGKVYDGSITGEILATGFLFHLLYGYQKPDTITKSSEPKAFDMHHCEDGLGVADIIGVDLT